MAPTTAVRHTERTVLDALHRRYGAVKGNGPRYVCAEHVRNDAGFRASRTADLIAMDLWPAQGNELIGHEVKVSRADWQTELRDPTKAEAFKRHMDRWYLVAPAGVAQPEELPDGWGLLIVDDAGGTRIKVRAPKLTPEPVPRGLLAAFARATAKTAARMTRREILPDADGVPCRHCRSPIKYAEDGAFRHVDGDRRACRFPESDWRSGYGREGGWVAAP